MSAEDSFFAVILQNPADDLPKLVFADWLDERDDPRGAFVRTAVAFDHPPALRPARFRLADDLRGRLADPTFPTPLPASAAFRWGWRRGRLAVTAQTKTLGEQVPEVIREPLKSQWIERVEFDGYTHNGRPDWETTFGLVRNAREVHFATDNYGPEALNAPAGRFFPRLTADPPD